METKRNLPYVFITLMLIGVLGTIFPPPVTEAEQGAAKFDAEGAFMLPEGYRTWVYIGGSVTPNEMNKGAAAFPEFHNTYMDPQAFRIYGETGKFPDGTIVVKETVGVGSKTSLSGNGYFMGDFVGLFAMVKDASRFPDEPDNWAFFVFKKTPGEPPADKARALPTASCSACHQAAAEERVFSQHYPVLRHAKPE